MSNDVKAKEKAKDVGAPLRRMIYDPDTPDFAFLTQQEVEDAFFTADSTLRTWRREGRFPEPIKMPGGFGYFVGDLRRFLQEMSGFPASGRRRAAR